MAINGPESPRQKMINLMYIVLMALLALNISTDVLNGFTLVEDSLKRTTANSTTQNQAIYSELAAHYEKNPEKVKEWLDKATQIQTQSDSLYQYIDKLKIKIVQEADGADGDINDIQNRENLEAASVVMLGLGGGEGAKLYKTIGLYKNSILEMITDSIQKQIIASNFATKVPQKALTLGRNWQEYMFENIPVAAAITVLSKLQSDIRYAEGEVLHTLLKNIDVGDLRVNQINAYVIPNAQTVVRGSKFAAQIILAAVDSTQRPSIFVGNKELDPQKNGLFETICGTTGTFSLTGYLELINGDGSVIKRNFTQPYTVVEPSATVSASLMNVLYAGYDNPINISVPGVPNAQVQATISNGNGTLKPTNGGYTARPTTVGKEAIITVTATIEGRNQVMGQYPYRVRQLPDPTPFIEYKDENGISKRYRGGTGFSKSLLVSSDGIVAAIDDGLLNVNFRVLSFVTVFYDNSGNAVPEISNGTNFSSRQKEAFRKLSRGKRFYISTVKAIGPDGIERQLPTTLEVIVN